MSYSLISKQTTSFLGFISRDGQEPRVPWEYSGKTVLLTVERQACIGCA